MSSEDVTMVDPTKGSMQEATPAMDDELSLPRATVYKMIMEQLPPGLGCSKETRDLLVDCCNEFVHLISSEANEVCEKSGRKTISPEHVLDALKNLGFGEYLEDVKASYEEHTEKSKEKERVKASSRAEMAKLSPEELERQQQELFEQSRIKFLQQRQAQSSLPASSGIDTPAKPVAVPSKPNEKTPSASSSGESLALSES